MKKNRNRAERRAGMSNPEAERRDYLFEHGDDRREERRKGDRRDGYGKNRYDERQDNGRDQHGKNRRNDRYGKGDKFDKRDRAGYGRNDDFGSRRHNAGRDFERSDSRDFERPRKPRRNERSHEDYGFSYDERSHDGRRQSMRNTRQGEGGKRIHRKNENRIVRDERSEGAKRHERRMIAKYGNTEGPNRRHSKKNRHNAPFRMNLDAVSPTARMNQARRPLMVVGPDCVIGRCLRCGCLFACLAAMTIALIAAVVVIVAMPKRR